MPDNLFHVQILPDALKTVSQLSVLLNYLIQPNWVRFSTVPMCHRCLFVDKPLWEGFDTGWEPVSTEERRK